MVEIVAVTVLIVVIILRPVAIKWLEVRAKQKAADERAALIGKQRWY